ncbi:VanZ family protein [Ulvibacterium sp.]|uniref:VanZ family protein n=1 Tax=Ulvibacterium sp. TaxID=2665914 RepID=UPI003BACF133
MPNIQIPHLDKIIHFTFYFVAAILGLFSFRKRIKSGTSLLKIITGLFLCLVVFGIIIEVIQQRYTMTRAGDVFDALANTIGALIGGLTAKMIFSSKKRLNWK